MKIKIQVQTQIQTIYQKQKLYKFYLNAIERKPKKSCCDKISRVGYLQFKNKNCHQNQESTFTENEHPKFANAFTKLFWHFKSPSYLHCPLKAEGSRL